MTWISEADVPQKLNQELVQGLQLIFDQGGDAFGGDVFQGVGGVVGDDLDAVECFARAVGQRGTDEG